MAKLLFALLAFISTSDKCVYLYLAQKGLTTNIVCLSKLLDSTADDATELSVTNDILR